VTRTALLPLVALLAGLGCPLTGRAIANGEPATAAQFADETPWAVLLVHGDGPAGCTGSLIAPQFVLTAAHCASDGLTVLYGSRSREAARRVVVREVIRHPGYTSQPITNDLALLRLAYPLHVRPVPIATRAESWDLIRPGAEATIVGWGATPGVAGRPDLLHRADIRFEEVRIMGTHIAYTAPRGGPCTGDSGGPLLITGHDGKPVLVGIASVTGGNLCDTGGGLAGYTHVAALQAFIREHVPDLPERLPPLEFGKD